MTGLIFERADGSSRAVRGYKMCAPSPDAKRFAASRLGAAKLPPKVDLRPWMTAVEDQADTNSCTANAVAGAYEYLCKRHWGEEAYDVSRMFIYYNARYLDDPEEIADEGCFVAKAIDGLREYGACSEETWAFDQERVNEEPSAEAYEEAAEFLVEDVVAVPAELEAWRACLAEGNPIIFGLKLFGSFDKQRKKGFVSMPGASDAKRGSHGGHAMLCVGYSDPDRLFIVRNSWGRAWGDAGYCYIPYDYVMNEDYNFGDSWIIRRLEELALDENTWGDDASIVPDLEHELANMSEEDYQTMVDALGDVHLETRIALIFLAAAQMDGEISTSELDALSEYLATVLEQLGSDLSPQKVLRRAMRKLDDDGLVEQSIELLGEHLSNAMLAGMTAKVKEVIGSDELSEDEQTFVDQLVETWQVAEDEEDDSEEEDEEDDEGADEDDEDDEDGEDEGEEDA